MFVVMAHVVRSVPCTLGMGGPSQICMVFTGGSSKQVVVSRRNTGICKCNTSCTSNSRTFYDTKRLRNIVYIFMHNLNNPETPVTNCMSGTTHTDAFTAQY